MAFEDACRKVIDRARAANTEIVIWRDGKIVELSPDEATAELEANLAKRAFQYPKLIETHIPTSKRHGDSRVRVPFGESLHMSVLSIARFVR